jgi:NAD(P)H-hydrate epimerase
LDSTLGTAGSPTVRADATLTLALPKSGLMKESARTHVGSLYLADISVPPELYHKLGLEVQNFFENDAIIKIRE